MPSAIETARTLGYPTAMSFLRDLMALRYEGKLLSTKDPHRLVKIRLMSLEGSPSITDRGIECLKELQSEPVRVLERVLNPE